MFRARFVFLSHRYPLVSTNLSLESRVCTNECPDDGAYLSRGRSRSAKFCFRCCAIRAQFNNVYADHRTLIHGTLRHAVRLTLAYECICTTLNTSRSPPVAVAVATNFAGMFAACLLLLTVSTMADIQLFPRKECSYMTEAHLQLHHGKGIRHNLCRSLAY